MLLESDGAELFMAAFTLGVLVAEKAAVEVVRSVVSAVTEALRGSTGVLVQAAVYEEEDSLRASHRAGAGAIRRGIAVGSLG